VTQLLQPAKLSPGTNSSTVTVDLFDLGTTSLARLLSADAQSLSSETARGSPTQERPKILCDPKIRYRVHNSLSMVPILREINPVQTIPTYISLINFNIIYPCLGLSIVLFSSDSPTEILYAFIFSISVTPGPSHFPGLQHSILVE
jgi:hypothetical protein